jgi:predicted dehydrogenase
MRIGFIGGHGHHYLRAALEGNEAAFAGDGHDVDPARQLASSLGVSTWFDDPVSLLEKFKPDVVSIGGVYAFNGDIAVEALGRDVPAVSDKPIAASWPQLQRLHRLTAQKTRVLLTEFHLRCQPAYRAAQKAVAEGRVGKVILATAQTSYQWGQRPSWYADRQKYGGTLLWIGSHGVDAVSWVTGLHPTRVTGRQGKVTKIAEDHVAVLMEMTGGATVVVHADFLRPDAATHGDDRLRIAGSEGVLEIRDGRCHLTTRTSAQADITDSVGVQPIHLELLAGMRGESQWFSTGLSLATAEVLLHARDAVDGENWIDLPVVR